MDGAWLRIKMKKNKRTHNTFCRVNRPIPKYFIPYIQHRYSSLLDFKRENEITGYVLLDNNLLLELKSLYNNGDEILIYDDLDESGFGGFGGTFINGVILVRNNIVIYSAVMELIHVGMTYYGPKSEFKY